MNVATEVYRYMTPCPHTIQRDAPIAKARELMTRFSIRHLPVLDSGDLVGVLSERDIVVAEKLGDPFRATVDQAMTPDPYFALPSTPLGEVAREMARRRYGAAVIIDRGNVIGVFTAVDALRALADDASAPAPLQ
jgi:acetoin utilization protein AcuB